MFRSAALCLALAAGAVAHPAAAFAPSDITVAVVDDNGQRLAHYDYRGHVPRGDRRRYVQADQGAHYGVRVRNNTPRRIAFVLAVDGRNTISGERSELAATEPMMVLGPWQTHTVRGWRTDLGGVHRFYFTDQADSYAQAFGDASALGVIAVAAFRERPAPPPVAITPPVRRHDDRAGNTSESRAAAPAAEYGGAAADAPTAAAPQRQQLDQAKAATESLADADSASRSERQRSAATGFGNRLHAPARYTQFEPLPRPFARDFVKYEWAERLVALGIIERPVRNRFWPETSGHFAPVPRRN